MSSKIQLVVMVVLHLQHALRRNAGLGKPDLMYIARTTL